VKNGQPGHNSRGKGAAGFLVASLSLIFLVRVGQSWFCTLLIRGRKKRGKVRAGYPEDYPRAESKKGQSQTFMFSSFDIWTSEDIGRYVDQTAI
jgi:hypothetical protein